MRTRAFKITTAVLLLAAIAGPLAVVLWPEGDGSTEVTVGVVEAPVGVTELIAAFGSDVGYEVSFEDMASMEPEEIDAMLRTGEVNVVVVSSSSLRWLDDVDGFLRPIVVAAIQQTAFVDGLGELGLSATEITRALAVPEMDDEFIEEATSQDTLASGLAFAGLMLAFISAQFVGQLAMMGVVEEKSTGVVEVLLGHVRPHVLLTGKVIGLTAIALMQILIVLAGICAALALTDAIDVPDSVWRFMPVLLVTLVIGMITYAALFALLGSLISRQEDASQVVFPAMLPLFLGYFAGQFFTFEDASTVVARVLTFFPLTTPMILPVRVARDAIGGVEFAVATVVLALSLAVVLRLAGRVYAFTLLRSGTRVPWIEVVRLLAGR